MNTLSWTPPERTTVPQALGGTPLVLHATQPDLVPLVDWLADHRDELAQELVKHGALLIRGADAASPERFERVVRALQPELKNDYMGTSPRDALTDHVFEASGLPGFYPIPQHIEMSFTAHPPERLFFGALRAPDLHGETPLCDFRAVWRDLDPAVRDRFQDKGVRIVRNYRAPGEKGDLFQLKPWEDMFGTTDKDYVTEKARSEGFEPVWLPGDRLRLVSEHEAARPHPVTGEMVWFNHVQVFHLSAGPGELKRVFQLRPSARAFGAWQLAAWMVRWKRLTSSPDEHPMHCTWRDGTEIPDADVEAVREAIWKNMVRIPWQTGDVMVIDNFSVSHGRMPYEGPREICVAWA